MSLGSGAYVSFDLPSHPSDILVNVQFGDASLIKRLEALCAVVNLVVRKVYGASDLLTVPIDWYTGRAEDFDLEAGTEGEVYTFSSGDSYKDLKVLLRIFKSPNKDNGEVGPLMLTGRIDTAGN